MLVEAVLEDLFGADSEPHRFLCAIEPLVQLLTQARVLQSAWIEHDAAIAEDIAVWCTELLHTARQQQQSVAAQEAPDTLRVVIYTDDNCVVLRLRRHHAWQDSAEVVPKLSTAIVPLIQAVADMHSELTQMHLYQARARQHAGEARVLHTQYQQLLEENLRQNELLFEANEVLEDRVRQRTSELEKTMATVRSQAQKMQELIQFKDELVRMIVHDLKTPLGVVISVLDGVLSGFFDIERDDKLISTATQSARNMLDMVETMLDISRLEAGHLNLNLDECAVNELLLPAIETVQILADERNVSIVQQVDQAVYEVTLDQTLLRRVLTNLLSNAARFAEPGSQIVVSVNIVGDNVEFAVANDGININAEDQPKIFDMFVSLKERQASKRKSTGIGLTFCKLAVEAHGGRIWVKSPLSAERSGARFCILLPLYIGNRS